MSSRTVPTEVLAALLAAGRDDNPRVAVEALYALGALSAEPCGDARKGLLTAAAPPLIAMTVASDAGVRFAAVRVIGRMFERRFGDEPLSLDVGDALIIALNDQDRAVKRVAMETLGVIRYERAAAPLTQLYRFYGRGELAEAALWALARLAQPASNPIFSAELNSKSFAMRLSSVEGLARSGNRIKLVEIQTSLRDEKDENLQLAATFASVLLSGSSIDRLTDSLLRETLRDQSRDYLVEIARGRTAMFGRYTQEPEARLKADVADILGLAGDPTALSIVEPLARDSDRQVAVAAERALARLR